MQHVTAKSLQAATRHSRTNASAIGNYRTSATKVTRRALTTSSSTQQAVFLDTLRKNHTTPKATHTVGGTISSNVSSGALDELENPSRFLRMIIFGKPGAGKGTLTQRLLKKYDLVALSTGDLLRQHIAEGTDIGREAEEIVARGGLLPDEVVLRVVTSKLDALKNKNWILDGFPRTSGQGELLDAHLNKHDTPLTLVVNIDVPDDVILSRISDRWIHQPSGRVYNMSYNRPRIEGLDDETGEPLTKRPDDNPEVFARRLESFYGATSPLLNYYAAQAAKGDKVPRSPFQHPHQVSFLRPQKLRLATLNGATSDENWPLLDEVVRQFPALKERVDSLRMRHSLGDAIVASGVAAANAYRNSQTTDLINS